MAVETPLDEELTWSALPQAGGPVELFGFAPATFGAPSLHKRTVTLPCQFL
jgi:hypothetical protein